MSNRINDTQGHEYIPSGALPFQGNAHMWVRIRTPKGEIRLETIDRSPVSEWLPPGCIGGGWWWATADASAEVFQDHGMLPKVDEYW
jgi:hypothetical protein